MEDVDIGQNGCLGPHQLADHAHRLIIGIGGGGAVMR